MKTWIDKSKRGVLYPAEFKGRGKGEICSYKTTRFVGGKYFAYDGWLDLKVKKSSISSTDQWIMNRGLSEDEKYFWENIKKLSDLGFWYYYRLPYDGSGMDKKVRIEYYCLPTKAVVPLYDQGCRYSMNIDLEDIDLVKHFFSLAPSEGDDLSEFSSDDGTVYRFESQGVSIPLSQAFTTPKEKEYWEDMAGLVDRETIIGHLYIKDEIREVAMRYIQFKNLR